MKQIWILFLIFIGITPPLTISAQTLSAGFFSGICYSDIHTNNYSGSWKTKTGPSQGILVDYSINKILGIRTGAGYSTMYYSYSPYINESGWTDYPSMESVIAPTYYPIREMMDFRFLTLPAEIRISIPAKPQLNLSGGIFYSFLRDYDLNLYHPMDDLIQPQKEDFGYTWSAGISYPVLKNLTASFDIRYITGRKEFFENMNYRHGSTDITLGMAYNISLQKAGSRREIKNDTLSEKLFVIYYAGANIAWNSARYFKEKYSLAVGPSLGISVKYKVAPRTFLQTGISFERTGYSLNDSSSYFYRYENNYGDLSSVDTRTTIDYIVIPALIEFTFGKKNIFFFNTGPFLGTRLNARCNGTAYREIRLGSSYTRTETTVSDDIEGLIRNNDHGWLFGTGVIIPFYREYKINLALLYRQGFTDAFNRSYFSDHNITEPVESIIRTAAVTFHIGIKIPSGKL